MERLFVLQCDPGEARTPWGQACFLQLLGFRGGYMPFLEHFNTFPGFNSLLQIPILKCKTIISNSLGVNFFFPSIYIFEKRIFLNL
jgi:hypothetical protein